MLKFVNALGYSTQVIMMPSNAFCLYGYQVSSLYISKPTFKALTAHVFIMSVYLHY